MGNYHDLNAEIHGAGAEAPFLSTIIERQVAWLFQYKTGVDFDSEKGPEEFERRVVGFFHTALLR